MSFLNAERSSGVLAHITSLPSPFGIGDIGKSSYEFLNFLEKCGQKCWQILPTGVGNRFFDNSPYMSSSAFAGSPLLLSPELLIDDGYLSPNEIANVPDFSPYTTDFKKVTTFKQSLLSISFNRFKQNLPADFEYFTSNTTWLEDYTLFMALKEKFDDESWYNWPTEFRDHKPTSLTQFKKDYPERLLYYQFEQYIFFKQWERLKQFAKQKGINIFGDIPIYVSLDSADVWANQHIFTLDSKGKPTHVSGVPPDYFAKTGQRWGNPLYRWDSKDSSVQNDLIAWWVYRFKTVFQQVDIARIDHFRAFESYWSIPEAEETAINGTWLQGPGKELFKKIFAELGELQIVAEDLGIITDEVKELRDELKFPGMKVLQFGFDGNPKNEFLPHNFTTTNCVCYTGTHDNNTTVGWFLDNELDDSLRTRIKNLANRNLHDNQGIHDDFIFLSHSSTAVLSIIPLQDVLGFGGDCRFNTPGVATGNWRWRCAPEFLTNEVATKLKNITQLFGRL